MSMPENIENTEELVNTIKGQIADKEKEIQENFTKLGEVYYVKYAKDPDGDFSELCQEIENQYQEINQMEQQILDLTLEDPKICPQCGTKNAKDSLFCGECGCKLPEEKEEQEENICPNCGGTLRKGDRFCRSCGAKVVVEEQEIQPAQPKQQIYTEPQNEPKRSSKSWIIALACVIVVVVGIFGFQYLKSEDKKEATATTENKTSAKTTENNAGEDVADAKDSTEKSQVLSYTDNKDMDLSACTDSDDYQYVSSEDNSFEFAYPKYLFNRSYVNKTGNQYTLEYANSDKADDYEIKAVISSQKAGSGNAVKSVQKLYKQKKKSIKNVTYAYPQGGKTPKLYQGKSSMIVMGYLDSDKTKCEYVLLTSDGKKDYMMQINFFDSDYKDEYKEINYVVDCMYRGCSFTNSTYQMRTFDQFREDDMGVKK